MRKLNPEGRRGIKGGMMSKENEYVGKFKGVRTETLVKKFKEDIKIKNDTQDLKMT